MNNIFIETSVMNNRVPPERETVTSCSFRKKISIFNDNNETNMTKYRVEITYTEACLSMNVRITYTKCLSMNIRIKYMLFFCFY